MMRQAQKIEVGMFEGRLGFTLEYTDGDRAHILFHKDIARQVAERLLRLVADLDYLDRQMAGAPADGVRIQDHCSVKLTGGDDMGVSG